MPKKTRTHKWFRTKERMTSARISRLLGIKENKGIFSLNNGLPVGGMESRDVFVLCLFEEDSKIFEEALDFATELSPEEIEEVGRDLQTSDC